MLAQNHDNQATVLSSKIIKTESIDWRKMEFIQGENFKKWDFRGKENLAKSILKYQFIEPFMVWESDAVMYCLDGRHRYLDLMDLVERGYDVPEKLPATFIECSSRKEAAELVLVYSSKYASITEEGLFEFLNTYELDFGEMQGIMNIADVDNLELMKMFNLSDELTEKKKVKDVLRSNFIVPPFSILDTRAGYWQDRKRKWSDLGFNSQETRGETELIAKSGQSTAVYELRNQMRELSGVDPSWDEILNEAKKRGMHVYEGASIFDPVLCELMYRWFCIDNGTVLDPFAGGSVRGIVAAFLGLNYFGIDLREEQCIANSKQWALIKDSDIKGESVWIAGDSNNKLDSISNDFADFLFSCPPYADLEKYSDDPKDLSNMSYEVFKKTYYEIIFKAASKVKQDRFACFVVGDIRDKKGMYRNFVSHTIEAFELAGFSLYNEIVLINTIGSLAVRVRKQFNSGRKVGKTHQNVLVFYKGDPKKIKDNFQALDLSSLEQTE